MLVRITVWLGLPFVTDRIIAENWLPRQRLHLPSSMAVGSELCTSDMAHLQATFTHLSLFRGCNGNDKNDFGRTHWRWRSHGQHGVLSGWGAQTIADPAPATQPGLQLSSDQPPAGFPLNILQRIQMTNISQIIPSNCKGNRTGCIKGHLLSDLVCVCWIQVRFKHVNPKTHQKYVCPQGWAIFFNSLPFSFL